MASGLARAAEELSAAGDPVRYLGCTHVPGEDSCFSRFEGASETLVQRVLDAAAVPSARILATDEFPARPSWVEITERGVR